jgi:hypothetical protein
MMTGEGAEEIVEELGISHDIIHEHEEVAETFMKVLYGLGILSILGLVATIKKHAKATVVSYIVLVLAIGSAVLSKSVGTSGGEIRHTEIRSTVSDVSSDVKTEDYRENDDH